MLKTMTGILIIARVIIMAYGFGLKMKRKQVSKYKNLSLNEDLPKYAFGLEDGLVGAGIPHLVLIKLYKSIL